MTHAEFVDAYQSGRARVDIDRKAAFRFVAGRLMLHFLLLPLFGGAVALGLMRAFGWAFALLALAFLLRFGIAVISPGFVLQKSLKDAEFYALVRDAGILYFTPLDP
jgi:hypothetical protein